MASWPRGTGANASSVHPDNTATQCDGCYRTYIAYNAVDGNVTTFWNDDTEGQFPDNLTIAIPSPISLTGLQVISNSDGYINAYDVYLYTDSQWIQAVSVSGLSTPNSTISRWMTAGNYADSTGAVSNITAVMISVNAAPDLGGGAYSRINEIYPIYADAELSPSASSSSISTSPTSKSASSTTTTSTTTSSTTSSTSSHGSKSSPSTGAIAGGVVGGILALTALAIIGIFLYKKTQKTNRKSLPDQYSPTEMSDDKQTRALQLPQELDGNKRLSTQFGVAELPSERY